MIPDRNCETSLMIQKRSGLSPVDSPNPISRREFLYRGGATALVVASAPLAVFTQQSVANPVLPWLAWTGRIALAEGISWLVNRVLDRTFPDFGNNRKAAERLADELNVKKVDRKPTADRFHNRYASRYGVMNRAYRFDSDYSNKFAYYVQLNPYLRSDNNTPLAAYTDLSIPEIQGIAREENCYGTILSPSGERRRPRHEDHVGFRSTCRRKYRIDPNRVKLEYVRTFKARFCPYPAYGVKINRQRYLLISV